MLSRQSLFRLHDAVCSAAHSHMRPRSHCSRSPVCDNRAEAIATARDRSAHYGHQMPVQRSDVFVVLRRPRSRQRYFYARQTTTIRPVPEWDAQLMAGWSRRSVLRLFLKNRGDRGSAHAQCAGNRTLRQAFQTQFLDSRTSM